ncbi:hypothetical protein Hypma_001956 [Hypsizygus marmoreus]|uniref:Uncharacterized protein n=1 Tax=Hypsizygus marmoreus TaxID=39966 RepID=A0A369J794_HYPMA|nr:hypothetical protein Hypma_001956 [Hypsizygus marmoreus]
MATRSRSSKKSAPKKAAYEHEMGRNRNRRGSVGEEIPDADHFAEDVGEEGENANTATSDRDEDGDYGEDEEEVKQYDSDALDDEDFGMRVSSLKRKRGTSSASPQKKKKTVSRRPSSRRTRTNGSDDEDADEFELKNGQEVVGVVVQAPKTGRVPPGQISQNTLDFLTKLQDPKCNDREWFKLHEPVYRLAETEWKDFIEALTTELTEVDAQIPPLPPKDVIHRIYRDVRFSNDKTPYKTGLSSSFSRSGRKGIFAGYHVLVPFRHMSPHSQRV